MADLARDLRSPEGSDATMDHLVRAAVSLLDSCTMAAITLVRRGGAVETAAASDPLAARGDQMQYELGEGPCLDAAWKSEVVHSGNLSTDPRWPRWAPRVAPELGVRSMLCVRLFTHEQTLGALNLYAETLDAFEDGEVIEATAIAAHAAVTMAATQKIDQLGIGLARRTVTDRPPAS